MLSKILNFVLIAGIVILGLSMISQCKRANAAEADAEALWKDQTELTKTYKDKEGRLTSEVEQVNLNNQKLLQDLAEKENDVKNLKGKVQSLTKINRTLSATDTVHHTKLMEVPGDTIRKDSFIYVYPNYVRDSLGDGEWFDLSINVGRYHSSYNLNVYDSLVITHRRINRVFKPDQYIIDVKSMSPMIQRQEVNSYNFEEKINKWSLGFQFGYGVTKELTLTPYVGLGLNYHILQW